MNRRDFVINTALAAGAIAAIPSLAACTPAEKYPFPLLDLHVHTSENLSIEQMMKVSKETGVKFGVVDHPASWALKDDADLKKHIDTLRKYPVYVGLQPTNTNWTGGYSPELLKQLDYILMDPQTIPLEDGSFMYIWQFDTYVDNTEEFMERYMAHSMNILKNEPINIFGWPLFLPVCIARDYYTLWTKTRLTALIDAAKARNIAFEINDMSHTPHEDFILMAKEAGLKFTFGSDQRSSNIGRLAYCKAIAQKCKLTADDFWVPKKNG